MSEMKVQSKKLNVIAWILLLVGGVLAIDGLLQIVGGNNSRTGESALGGVLAMTSTLFFVLARRKPKVIAD